MKLADNQDKVFDRLVALGADKKFGVFEGAIPLGYEQTVEFGQHAPYIIVGFGGQSEVQMGYQGISGTRDNLKWTSVAVEAVANSPATVRRVADLIRDSLEGFSPDEDWGELVEQMSGDYSIRRPEFDLWPVRYASGMVFSANSNASN